MCLMLTSNIHVTSINRTATPTPRPWCPSCGQRLWCWNWTTCRPSMSPTLTTSPARCPTPPSPSSSCSSSFSWCPSSWSTYWWVLPPCMTFFRKFLLTKQPSMSLLFGVRFSFVKADENFFWKCWVLLNSSEQNIVKLSRYMHLSYTMIVMGILPEISNSIVFLNVRSFKLKINCYWKYYWSNLSFLRTPFVDCILPKISF